MVHPDAPKRPVILLAASLLILASFAGCLGEDDRVDGDSVALGADTSGATQGTGKKNTSAPQDSASNTDADGNETPDENTTGGSTNNTTGNQTDSNGTDDDPTNGTTDPDPVSPHVWGEPANATVRPGVNTVAGGAGCTTNFIFKARNNDTYYIGSASHCVQKVGLGGPVTVKTIKGTDAFVGTVAFDSFTALGYDMPDGAVSSDTPAFDFALIEIPADKLDLVHPAVQHWGGPTKLGGLNGLGNGVRIINFGQSGLRPIDSPLDRQEGVSTGSSNSGWSQHGYLHSPGIPGDSGSGLMTLEGAAIGALSTISVGGISVNPFGDESAVHLPGENTWSSVPKSVDWLATNGFPVDLQTWKLLGTPILP